MIFLVILLLLWMVSFEFFFLLLLYRTSYFYISALSPENLPNSSDSVTFLGFLTMCTIDSYMHRAVLFFSNPKCLFFSDILRWLGPVDRMEILLNRRVLAFPIMQSYTSFQILIYCAFSLTNKHFGFIKRDFWHVIGMAMIFLLFYLLMKWIMIEFLF